MLAKGLCERIGIDGKFTYKPQLEGKTGCWTPSTWPCPPIPRPSRPC